MHIPPDTILLKLELFVGPNVFLTIPTHSIISLHILIMLVSVVITWTEFHIPMAWRDQGQVLLRDLLLDHGLLRSLLELPKKPRTLYRVELIGKCVCLIVGSYSG